MGPDVSTARSSVYQGVQRPAAAVTVRPPREAVWEQQEVPFLKSSSPGRGLCVSLHLGLASALKGREASALERSGILEPGGEDL